MEFFTKTLPGAFNEFVVKNDLFNQKNMITLKVFPSAPPDAGKISEARLDTSKDIFEQIAQSVHLEDWVRVDVVNENTPSSSDTSINLDKIQKIAEKEHMGGCDALMRLFKEQFNRDCISKIDRFRIQYKNVWLEVRRRLKPDWEQVSPQDSNAAFSAIDCNHDDVISRSEFMNVFRLNSDAQKSFRLVRPQYRVNLCKILGIAPFHLNEKNDGLAWKRFDIIDKVCLAR